LAVFSINKDAAAHALRASSAIFHHNPWPIRINRVRDARGKHSQCAAPAIPRRSTSSKRLLASA
jgi:hypothetical protein